MRFVLIRLMLVCYICAVPTGAFSAGISTELQKKYDGITSMTADFTQVLLHKETNTRENRSGILVFKKPLLVRWESKQPSPELLLVTAKEIWNAFPDEDIVYKYPLSAVRDSRSIVQVITGQARLDKDFTVEDEGKENGLLKLHLYPKDPSQALVEAIFWVDPATYLIKQIRVYDFYSNQNEITFTNQQVGAAIPASTFTFAPPKGMKVEDHTKDGGKGGKGKNSLLQ